MCDDPDGCKCENMSESDIKEEVQDKSTHLTLCYLEQKFDGMYAKMARIMRKLEETRHLAAVKNWHCDVAAQ